MKPLLDLGNMKIYKEEEFKGEYIVLKIGDQTFSTSYEDIKGGNDITVAKNQLVETKGIGVQDNLWIKGKFTESKRHIKLKTPISFELNIYSQNKNMEETNMASIKDEAQAYEPQQTKNIAELDKVPTNLELSSFTAKQGTEDEFTYKYLELNGEKYRVPGVVLGDLKEILKKQPNLEFFYVLRKGTGKGTRYQVLPWNANQVEEIKV